MYSTIASKEPLIKIMLSLSKKIITFGVVSVTLSSCIPLPRKTLVRPHMAISVKTKNGQPVENAKVLMVRYKSAPPPYEESHRWVGHTDQDGKIEFSEMYRNEWTLPLVIHGVSYWGWKICVKTTKSGTGYAHWDEQDRHLPNETEKSETVNIQILLKDESNIKTQRCTSE